MRDINAGAKRGFLANGLALLAEVYCDKLREAEKGEAVARECLSIAPHYANAHFQLGKALVAQRRFDEARAAYEAAIADEVYAHLQFVVDDQVYVWKAHSEIGSSYVAQGDDRRAAEWFRKGLARAPGVEPLQINLARCLERQGVHAEAEQLFRTAYEQHRTEQTTVDYVNVLLRRGRGAKALQIIEASCERLGDDTACALLVAASQVATKLGLRNAHEYLERAAERKPYAAEILNPLEAHYRVRRDEAALARLLERERAHAPRTALDCLRRSHQALAVGDFAAAIALAEKGIGLEGTSGKLRYNAALACARQGLKARAVEHLRHIDFQDDVYCSAQLLRAATERELGHIADALESVDRLLSRDPQNVDGLLLRASICEAMDDAHAAEASLIAAYDADRRRGGVELAAFYLRRERYGDAARVADEALAS
jgi:tetratricopeptide (TPR) repeat protein